MTMKPTIAYVDGFNLFYGLLKGTRDLWLDPVEFVRRLLREDHDIQKVKYFSAPLKTYPYDRDAVESQNAYFQALSILSKVELILGFYSKNPTYFPAYDESCRKCEKAKDGMVRVVKLEEKRSDVNIATSMVLDAVNNRAESFVLVSGDTDFIGPVNIVRKDYGKNVIVLNPHTRRSDLKQYASYYKDIPRDLPSQCQLPDEIPIGTHGNVIRRPLSWQ